MINFLIFIVWFVIGMYAAFVVFNCVRQLLFWFPKIVLLAIGGKVKISATVVVWLTNIALLSLVFIPLWLFQNYVFSNLTAFIAGGIASFVTKCYLDLFDEEDRLMNKAEFIRFTLKYAKKDLSEITHAFVKRFSALVMESEDDPQKLKSTAKVIRYCPDLLKCESKQIRSELIALGINQQALIQLMQAIENRFEEREPNLINPQEKAEEIAQLFIESHNKTNVNQFDENNLMASEEWAAKMNFYSKKVPDIAKRVSLILENSNVSDEIFFLWVEIHGLEDNIIETHFNSMINK